MIENPAKRATSGRKRNGFLLSPMSSAKQKRDKFNGFMSQAMLSMASDARILANTPNLKAIYEFLEKDKV